MICQPLRIGLCITDLDLGGAEQCLANLATQLDRGQFEPTVYCLGPSPRDPRRSVVPRLQSAGIPVRFLEARRARQFPWVVQRLARMLRLDRPEVLQSFLFHANLVGRVAGRLAGVPVVLSGIRVAERACRWHLWLDRWTQRLADRYVCVSRSVARFTASQACIPARKLVVIANGVDVNRFAGATAADLAEAGVARGRRVVVCVGRLARQKGCEWLIQSAPTWLGRLPECDLLLVGDGPMRPALERGVAQLGLAGRVHFAGFREDVPELLAASRLLVLPSRWEGMANALLEAMAAGLPIVASRVEGVEELLGAGTEEQTVDFGDTEALSARIVQLLRQPQRASELGAGNRARAAQQFDLPSMIRAYADLWQALAAS